ncbi:MAG: hypothetical protein IKQ91_04140 [Oscillospiraceae bacterium]|nr:hypothetical protein [Oscillospiraceae bacterium]
MKNLQMNRLLALLPEEYLDEAVQYHMAHSMQESAAEPAGAAFPNAAEDIIRQARHSRNIQKKQPENNMSGVDILKMETRKSKMLLVILAAAVLAVGGTAAAVAYGAYKRVQQLDLESKLTEDELPPDNINVLIFPKLTDQQDEPDCHGYAKTDTGFFYLKNAEALTTSYSTGGVYDWSHNKGLGYYDEESGETVFVCAKPNCLHDGNEFCVATTKNYSLISDPVYLDGYVYAVALDNRELLKNPEGCTEFPAVLMRYAPDGTEATAVAELYHSEVQYNCSAQMIAHRGQLWICTSIQQHIYTEDENLGITASQNDGCYSMFCYEPEPQRLTMLSSSGEPVKQYRQFNAFYDGPDFKGVGNYVYFRKTNGDWRDPVKGSGIFRIDCRTGLTEQVVNVPQGKCQSYTVSGDHVYYIRNTDSYSLNGSLICDYNIKTGETRELTDTTKIIQQHFSWYTEELAKEQNMNGIYAINLWFSAFFSDSEHLYLSWVIEDHRDSDSGNNYDCFTELDSDGNPLRCTELKAMPYPEEYIRSLVKQRGYYKETQTDGSKENYIPPEKLTEADIERAVKNWHPDYYLYDNFDSFRQYDGRDFWLEGEGYVYRISREDLFAGREPERLYQKLAIS